MAQHFIDHLSLMLERSLRGEYLNANISARFPPLTTSPRASRGTHVISPAIHSQAVFWIGKGSQAPRFEQPPRLLP